MSLAVTLIVILRQSGRRAEEHTAASNAVHEVHERLARWLLMCRDRVLGDEIHLKHQYSSIIPAVGRPSVTAALHVLEGTGFSRAGASL
jgi:hypothetical protein